MKKTFTIFILFLSCLTYGQIQISGNIIDANTKEALSFVNIGIRNKNIGVVSSELGAFSLLIPEKYLNDTLSFSLVGYKESDIPIKDIISSKQQIFPLKIKAVQLKPVNITAKKLIENKRGIPKTKPVFTITDASMNQNDIFEIAQVIKLNAVPSKITSVNLLINEDAADSGTFRINFYGFDDHKPTTRLIETNIIQKHAIKEGWLCFDLKSYNIYLKGEVTASIEFIPSSKNNKPIQYEVKLGGSSRSFVRSSSLGEWNTPPHHYRMYVTTLENNKQNQSSEDVEEKETPASTHLFSQYVSDTFSLFIHLPKNYSKKKKYPTVFLLDANFYYDIVNMSAQKINSKNNLTEPIIIGIGYKNFIEADSLRNRDYTFPKALASDSFSISGGADKFLLFFEKELLPYIDKNYTTNTNQRTLMGHSLGGYFTLFALQKQLSEKIPLFRNFVAASPSLDYYNQYLLSQFKELQNGSSATPACSLLLTTGSLEDGEDGGANFNSLLNILSSDKLKNISTTKIIIPKADHMETAVPTFEKGIELIIKN